VAILFDMDGTLVDSTAVVEEGWRRWATRHNLPLEEVLTFSHGRPTQDTMEHFLPRVDVSQEAEETRRYEETEMDGVCPVPGAIRVVQEAQNGLWGVVTSAPRRLAEVRMAAAGLPLPEVLVPADEIERGKPDPEGYLKAAKQLHVSPSECLVFEDTRPGIEAGAAAGIQVVALLTTFSQEQLAWGVTVRNFEGVRIQHQSGQVCVTIND
jgi:mannitol-1-/sugar-/sorbitol-6-phosphatase